VGAKNMASDNNLMGEEILRWIMQELSSLGVSINHLDHLNNDRELYRLTENLKQEFMNKIKETQEQGIFVNPGGG